MSGGGAHDGLAALRQRLFFASALLKMAERELAGEAINRQALAMACRNAAVLQLHGVFTGLLDEIVLRLRIDAGDEIPTIESTRRLLATRQLASPELSRVEGLLEPGGWLHACQAEVRRCLSPRAAGRRAEDGAAAVTAAESAAPRRIGMVEQTDNAPLSGEDLVRIRGWIDGWKSLLDEFLETFVEF